MLSSLDDFGLEDLPLLSGLVTHVGGGPLDLQDDLVALLVRALPEHRVCGRSPRIVPVEIDVIGCVYEELAAPGVGPSGVRHGDGPSHIGVSLYEFILNFVSRTAHSCSGGVSSLDHESFDDPVEDNAIIESLLGKFDEVTGGDGHVIVHLELDIAYIGMQNNESHDSEWAQ